MPKDIELPSDLHGLQRNYELIRELGQGGMAAVYLARRRDTGQLVAIKAIRPRYLDDPDAIQRFAREARTVAVLNHPNIVRTEGIEQIGDRALAIIMEYIPGGTVRDRLRQGGAFDPEQAETVLRDVASALRYAHQRGIVHRDVKPENVFLDERTGRALLSDFGIARRIEGDAPITLLGSALGTPQYMSPEQIDGGKVDGRSDIYSLGVLGWELLTGRRPWPGESLYGVIYKQKHEDLPRITTLKPRVPANLLFAIEGALAKNKAERWQSIDEFLSRLTYEPPPVLAQAAYPPSVTPPEDEATVKFRPATPTPASPVEPLPLTAAIDAALWHENGVDAEDAGPTRGEIASSPPAAEQHVPDAPIRGRARGRPLIRALALLVPLAIGAGSFYVVFGGRTRGAVRDDPNAAVTSSAGSVALDSARPADTVSRTRTAAPQPADTVPRQVAIPPRQPAPRQPAPREPVQVARQSARKAEEPKAEDPKAEDPFKPAPARPRPRPTSTATNARVGAPSPRCAVATMADQRACLLAHIAVNDASLQRVYDSLIAELRRIARTPRGAPDPPAVTRLRVEQRAWITARDRECTRRPALGSVPLWAGALSECFAQMSKVRAGELQEALDRVRRQ